MDPLTLLIIVLLILYCGGMGVFGFMAAGGLIHLLLVIVIIVVLVRVLRGQSV